MNIFHKSNAQPYNVQYDVTPEESAAKENGGKSFVPLHIAKVFYRSERWPSDSNRIIPFTISCCWLFFHYFVLWWPRPFSSMSISIRKDFTDGYHRRKCYGYKPFVVFDEWCRRSICPYVYVRACVSEYVTGWPCNVSGRGLTNCPLDVVAIVGKSTQRRVVSLYHESWIYTHTYNTHIHTTHKYL